MISNLTWPQVTDIKILRCASCTYWHPNENLKRWNCFVKTVALVWLQTFLRWGQQTRFGDLIWHDLAFLLPECAQWIFRKSHLVWARYLQRLRNGTRKTWRGPFRPLPARNGVIDFHWWCTVERPVAIGNQNHLFLAKVLIGHMLTVIYCSWVSRLAQPLRNFGHM